jgi:hypothetical protein
MRNIFKRQNKHSPPRNVKRDSPFDKKSAPISPPDFKTATQQKPNQRHLFAR